MKITPLFSSILFGALTIMTMISCSENERDSFVSNGKETHMTVYATRDGMETETRATLNEVNGNLNCSWEEGDKLFVTNTNGGVLGQLNLVNKEEGKFEGSLIGLNEDKMALNYFYLGSGTNLEAASGSYNVNIASQDGTMASLTKSDVLSAQAEVVIIDGNAYVTGALTLKRYFSFGHFTLKFPEGVSMNGESIAITGANLMTQASVSLADRSLSGQTAGTITVTGTNGDFYINLIPASGVAPTFKVTIGNTEYEGTLNARDIAAGIYLRDSGVGVPIEMAETKSEEDPSNPGNINNWGDDVDYPSVISGSFAKIGNSADAWCSNERSFQDFGFAAPVEYKSNAIKSGILTSASYTNGSEAKYFQWGRWLGFPQYAANAKVTMLSYAYSGTIAPPRGINLNTDYQLYYCWDMNSRPSYAYSSAWKSNGMKKEQAVNSSIIYLVGDYDYLSSSLQDLSWEERSGNPCPDGYRIPTEEELSVFVPSTSFSNSSHAEIKEINGSKYAMKWTVVDATHVSITSVYTSKSEVSVSDPIFNDAKTITLEANGMLYYQGNDAYFATSFNNGEKTSGYWTSTVGSLDGHKAGRALMIRIKNGTCSIVMEDVEYTAGLCIMPIKDAAAKATAIKPWLPLGY